MEDAGWLRLITIGLVLAAMAIAYFLLAQRFNSNNPSSPQTVQKAAQASPTVLGTSSSPIPLAVSSPVPSPSSESAYQTIASRSKSKLTQLPSTGSPMYLLGIFAIGILVAGFGLRKFPN